jgi:hypothetical protein
MKREREREREREFVCVCGKVDEERDRGIDRGEWWSGEGKEPAMDLKGVKVAFCSCSSLRFSFSASSSL